MHQSLAGHGFISFSSQFALMLSDLESAMALVEGQELEAVSAVKDGWQQALEDASKILKWPEGFTIQYNPAIWRGSRYTVGIRLLSNPFDDILIFEFSTPNYVLPFDCFASPNAKVGVMLHEIAHRIDDARWGFDLRGLRREAGDYITREQRAELLAFACCAAGSLRVQPGAGRVHRQDGRS